MNPNLWLKSWKIKHIDVLNLEGQLPQRPCPGLGQAPAQGCSSCVTAHTQGSGSSRGPVPPEELCLLARVSQVASHVAHHSSSSFFFKEWQLVINIGILDLKLCGPAADTHWGGYSGDVESCTTAFNWVLSCSEFAATAALWAHTFLCLYCLQCWINLRTVYHFNGAARETFDVLIILFT